MAKAKRVVFLVESVTHGATVWTEKEQTLYTAGRDASAHPTRRAAKRTIAATVKFWNAFKAKHKLLDYPQTSPKDYSIRRIRLEPA